MTQADVKSATRDHCCRLKGTDREPLQGYLIDPACPLCTRDGQFALTMDLHNGTDHLQTPGASVPSELGSRVKIQVAAQTPGTGLRHPSFNHCRI